MCADNATVLRDRAPIPVQDIPRGRSGETVELVLTSGALMRFSVGSDVHSDAQVIAELG